VKIFDSTKIPLLGKALDVYSLRQKVISSNIANVTTIGYRSKSVSFEEQIAGALEANAMGQAVTPEGQTAGIVADPLAVDPRVVDSPTEGTLSGDSLASGLNNVDIDNEMAGLAKNQIRFKFAARLLTNTFRDIQDSIRGQS